MYMFGVTEAIEHDANQASLDFMDYLRGVIAERRRQPREDLLTHMLTADRSTAQKLTEDEVISTAILLLNAGHEATVHTTGNGVKAILESGLDPKALFADRGADRGDGRGMPPLRRAAPHVHPLRPAGRDARGRPQLQAGRDHRPDARRRQPRPGALRRRQHASIRSAPTAPMSASAPASTSASARRWRGSSCRWR